MKHSPPQQQQTIKCCMEDFGSYSVVSERVIWKFPWVMDSGSLVTFCVRNKNKERL